MLVHRDRVGIFYKPPMMTLDATSTVMFPQPDMIREYCAMLTMPHEKRSRYYSMPSHPYHYPYFTPSTVNLSCQFFTTLKTGPARVTMNRHPVLWSQFDSVISLSSNLAHKFLWSGQWEIAYDIREIYRSVFGTLSPVGPPEYKSEARQISASVRTRPATSKTNFGANSPHTCTETEVNKMSVGVRCRLEWIV